MKLTKAQLKKIIKEEILKESLKADYSTLQKEVGEAEVGWKKRYDELEARQTSYNSVNSFHNSVAEIVKHFKKTNVAETLGGVKKSHVKKFGRAIGMLESILEDTHTWLDENK